MLTEKNVTEALGEILVPGIKRDLAGMNLLQEVKVSGGQVEASIATAALDESAMAWLRDKAADVVKGLDAGAGVKIDFVGKKPQELNQVKNVIAVMSGKGGVGKSLVTALSAILLSRKGYSVGILDADITGPSIPKMFGTVGHPSGSETGILPVLSTNGIEIISINLFLPSEDEAIIWRGPLIGKAISQFWEDVLWGRLDFLIVDLPPGTADAPLTAMQVLPITGVIIVFTPQDLTAMIVKKAVKMAQQMDKRVLGVVENMSYLYVPELKKKLDVFGRSRGDEMSAAAGAPLLARIPIDPRLAALCDEGHIERYDAEILDSYGAELEKVLSNGKLNQA